MIKSIHGLFAYFFLISALFFIIISLLARLAFISSHIQLVLGFILWYSQGYLAQMSQDMKLVMSEKSIRLLAVEHPAINILAIAILTIGFISIKKSTLDQTKHIKGILYFGIALILILSRIPYKTWLNL